MAKNKKTNFWLLVIIFSGITAVALNIVWNSYRGPDSVMMNQSMGNMMKDEHLKNITIGELLNNNPPGNGMGNSLGHLNHHGETDPSMFGINRVTTFIIFSLIPFIIGGTVFLAVIWIK